MIAVLKCLKTWMSVGLSFLKVYCLFFLLTIPIHGIYLGVVNDQIWSITINFMSFAVIFSSAMSFRTTCIILRETRRIFDDL